MLHPTSQNLENINTSSVGQVSNFGTVTITEDPTSQEASMRMSTSGDKSLSMEDDTIISQDLNSIPEYQAYIVKKATDLKTILDKNDMYYEDISNVVQKYHGPSPHPDFSFQTAESDLQYAFNQYFPNLSDAQHEARRTIRKLLKAETELEEAYQREEDNAELQNSQDIQNGPIQNLEKLQELTKQQDKCIRHYSCSSRAALMSCQFEPRYLVKDGENKFYDGESPQFFQLIPMLKDDLAKLKHINNESKVIFQTYEDQDFEPCIPNQNPTLETRPAGSPKQTMIAASQFPPTTACISASHWNNSWISQYWALVALVLLYVYSFLVKDEYSEYSPVKTKEKK